MPLEIITASFKERYWQPYQGYAFARHQAIVPLVRQELYRAATYMPLGFDIHQDEYRPVAILGQQNDNNLFIAPNGAWAGSDYIPAALRSHPFTLVAQSNKQHALAVDTDSGLVTDNPADQPFFDPANPSQPSARIQEILNFLTQIEQHRQATQHSCALLKKHQLLKPWALSFQRPQGTLSLEGIYTTDEEKLAQLSPDALAELRDGNALAMIYAQMLSSQLLRILDRLADAHDKAGHQPHSEGIDLDQLFGAAENDSFKF